MKFPLVATLALLVCSVVAESAQESPRTASKTEIAPEGPSAQREARRSDGAAELLRVQVVIARWAKERKVSSTPYTFLVTSDGKKGELKMGVEVPVAVTSFGSDGKSPTVSYQWRTVGTSMSCTARPVGEGRFGLELMAESSSTYGGPDAPRSSPPGEPSAVPSNPLFRSFAVMLTPILRDGQSVETVASTDPVSGEVVKIDLTLNVVK
jgi:hypothetical protein